MESCKLVLRISYGDKETLKVEPAFHSDGIPPRCIATGEGSVRHGKQDGVRMLRINRNSLIGIIGGVALLASSGVAAAQTVNPLSAEESDPVVLGWMT